MYLWRFLMKHKISSTITTAVLAIVSVTGCFSQKSASSTHAANTSWSGTRKAEVQDPVYGMTAYTINVPSGWKFVGKILRPGGCHPAPVLAAALSYVSESPDGLTAFAQLPGVSWTWTSNGSNMMGPKCPSNIPIDSAAGLLLNIAVPNLLPHATSVEIKPLSQTNQDAIKNNNLQRASQFRSLGRQFLDGARVVVEYQLNGVAVEESLFTLIDCTESHAMPMPRGVGLPPAPGYTKRSCSSRGTIIFRAPKGHLDELIKNAPPQPAINPAWDSRVINDMRNAFQKFRADNEAQFEANQQYFAEQNQQMLNRAKQFDANLQNSTNHAIANDRDRQAAIDNAAHQTSLYSLDQQTFINPSTGQKIEASNQFNHQWMSSDGSTLIQTQDNTLDPNGSVYPISQSWTELIPTN